MGGLGPLRLGSGAHQDPGEVVGDRDGGRSGLSLLAVHGSLGGLGSGHVAAAAGGLGLGSGHVVIAGGGLLLLHHGHVLAHHSHGRRGWNKHGPHLGAGAAAATAHAPAGVAATATTAGLLRGRRL